MSDTGELQPTEPDPLRSAAEALGRARAAARERGFRPGGPTGSGRPRRQASTGRGKGSGRDPRPVTEDVQRLVSERGWESEVQVGSVVGRWAHIVGSEVAEHIVPVAFEGTTLTVKADSTAWATQMRLLTNTVLGRIEEEVGDDVVSEIVVHGPGGPSWRKGPLAAPGRGPRDTYG